MKKLILVCCALFVVATAQAQLAKGDVQLGGTVSWNSQEFGQNKVSTLNINPNAGFFLSNNTSLGVIAGYSATNRDVLNNNNLQEFEDNLFEFGVYARFHKSLVDKLYIFLQPSIMIGSGESDIIFGTSNDVNTFDIQLIPGITYFFTEKWALEMRLGGFRYRNTKMENSNLDQSDDQFGLNLGLSNIGVGMSFYINK